MTLSPGLAFILGMIPGVGAIYNGQYIKGLVHVIIIGLTTSVLSNNAAGARLRAVGHGLLLAGFWFYMAFDAWPARAAASSAWWPTNFLLLPDARRRQFPVAPILLIVLGVIFLLNTPTSLKSSG